MTPLEIRPVQGHDLIDTAFALTRYAFQASPVTETDDKLEKYVHYSSERFYLVAFEHDMPVATGCTIPMTQTVRGNVYSMGGIAGIATHPSARRKGYAKQILMGLFAQMQTDQQPFSTLYPFRESFYGKLGYVNFPARRYLRIHPLNLQPLALRQLEGEVELLDMGQSGFDVFRDFMLDLQPSIHGMSMFPPIADSAKKEFSHSWVAVARDASGQVIGAMTYAMKEYRSDVYVPFFLYRNTLGKYLLLQWIARHGDQVREFIVRVKPDDRMETWGYDWDIAPHTTTPAPVRIQPQGRVMIVGQIGGMKTGEGRCVVRIHDKHCRWNNDVFQFETVNGALVVTRGGQPEFDLTIEGLSALIYGGYDPADFGFWGWGEVPTAMQERLRFMFPSMLPYIHADF